MGYCVYYFTKHGGWYARQFFYSGWLLAMNLPTGTNVKIDELKNQLAVAQNSANIYKGMIDEIGQIVFANEMKYCNHSIKLQMLKELFVHGRVLERKRKVVNR